MKREGHIWSKPQSLKLAKIPLIDLFHLFHKLKLTYSKFSEKKQIFTSKILQYLWMLLFCSPSTYNSQTSRLSLWSATEQLQQKHEKMFLKIFQTTVHKVYYLCGITIHFSLQQCNTVWDLNKQVCQPRTTGRRCKPVLLPGESFRTCAPNNCINIRKTNYHPRAARWYADSSLTLSGSTTVRGRVHSPHTA